MQWNVHLQWLNLVTVFSSVVGDDVAFSWICMIRILQTLLLLFYVQTLESNSLLASLLLRVWSIKRSQVYCLLGNTFCSPLLGEDEEETSLYPPAHYTFVLVFWFLVSFSRFYTTKIQSLSSWTCFYFNLQLNMFLFPLSISFYLHHLSSIHSLGHVDISQIKVKATK